MQSNKFNGPQDHGGDVYQSGANTVIRDFSASINPLGHPEGLMEALAEALPDALHYPDRKSARFISSASEYYRVPGLRLIAGNGSAELIDVALRAVHPRRLILCPPDFGLYERFVPEGCEIVYIPRIEAEGFSVDVSAIKTALRGGDVLLFSNPGNPSGHAISREAVLEVAAAAEQAGALFLLDEAFCDFCPERSVIDRAGDLPSLAVLRSMTKFFGIPGLRLGFLVASPALIAKVEELRQPWSVSTVAEAAGVYCLADGNWGEKSRQYVRRAREKFAAELAALPGVTPLPSEVNYILARFEPPAPDADRVFNRLREEGTLVRHCASFGLGSRYIRFAVRTVGENTDIIRHLKAFFR